MASARADARRHGRDFEYRIKKHWGGVIVAGQEGDVQVGPYLVECKFRTGLKLESGLTLRDFHDQMFKYEKSQPDQKVVLAYTGGRTYQNGAVWVSMREAEFLRLKHLDEDQQIIEAFKAEKAGDFDYAKRLIQELAVALARQMVTGGQDVVVDPSLSNPDTLLVDCISS
jgi:hypothetical protein